MKKLKYVVQTEIKNIVAINSHPYKRIFSDNNCLYVEKITYSK